MSWVLAFYNVDLLVNDFEKYFGSEAFAFLEIIIWILLKITELIWKNEQEVN